MRHSLGLLIMLIANAALGACAPTLAPVYAPATSAGVAQSGAPYAIEQVEEAVVAGAQAKGWTVVARAPGIVVAETRSGGHQARVRVLVNESGWRIMHEQSSPGLKYGRDPEHGEVIHRRYNHWVRLLDESIRRELANQDPGMAPPPPATVTLPGASPAETAPADPADPAQGPAPAEPPPPVQSPAPVQPAAPAPAQ